MHDADPDDILNLTKFPRSVLNTDFIMPLFIAVRYKASRSSMSARTSEGVKLVIFLVLGAGNCQKNTMEYKSIPASVRLVLTSVWL